MANGKMTHTGSLKTETWGGVNLVKISNSYIKIEGLQLIMQATPQHPIP